MGNRINRTEEKGKKIMIENKDHPVFAILDVMIGFHKIFAMNYMIIFGYLGKYNVQNA